MLAIIAAVVALAPGSEVRVAATTAPPVFVSPPRTPLRESRLCEGAARLQTGYEPALLFRDEDRGSARLRKLIEMPMAKACLVETAR